jgi:hypothetical protein
VANRIASIPRGALPGLSLLDWRYLAIAVKVLLLARIRHASLRAQKILRELQDKQIQSNEDTGGGRFAVSVLGDWSRSSLASWRSDCLLQAMAADLTTRETP